MDAMLAPSAAAPQARLPPGSAFRGRVSPALVERPGAELAEGKQAQAEEADHFAVGAEVTILRDGSSDKGLIGVILDPHWRGGSMLKVRLTSAGVKAGWVRCYQRRDCELCGPGSHLPASRWVTWRL